MDSKAKLNVPENLNSQKYKKQFKGVENFLRRVAFNLGNTPSQTEVKIISCIPIDVTDLQQKIIQLERQLDEVGGATSKGASRKEDENCFTSVTDDKPNLTSTPRKSSIGSQKKTAVHTAFCDPNYDYSSNNMSRKEDSGECHGTTPSKNTPAKPRKSTVSFIFPAVSTGDSGGIRSGETLNSNEEKSKSDDLRKNLFNKKNKFSKIKKCNKTHLVYYAQTDTTPFNSQCTHTKSIYKNKNSVGREYLRDMIRKQYKSGVILEELANTSQYSSPVCRDEEQTCQRPCPYDSDVCSCFRGQFYNIDQYVTNTQFNQFTTDPVTEINRGMYDDRGMYYDSTLYDIVPVKEKPTKSKKDVDCFKRKELKQQIDMKCWPENVRTKQRFKPYVVNYTFLPTKDIKKPPPTFNTRKANIKNFVTKNYRKLKVDEQVGNGTSNSCCVDLGEVQIKRVNKKGNTKILSEPLEPILKNVECVTSIVNNTDCQTTASVVETNTFDKTEITLNQIKSILQSVLAEVKTNSQIKKNENKVKKDAVVQKGVSMSNIQGGSRFLNSFTHSPFNMNPCDASCSRQTAYGHPSCGMQQYSTKCMQKYPVFIQATNHRLCSDYFQSSPVTKSYYRNFTVATNTEPHEEDHGKVTDKLIKELYRSMDLPTKDTSHSNYDDFKSYRTTPSKNNADKELKVVVSALFSNQCTQMDNSVTRDTNTSFISKLVSNTVSMQSQGVCTDHGNQGNVGEMRRKLIEEINDENDDNSSDTESKENFAEERAYTDDNETEISASESQTDNARPVKFPVKKTKPGLLKRFKSVFKTKEKKNETKVTKAKSQSSNFEDYQTIYSLKLEKKPRSRSNCRPRKSYSKIVYARQLHRESPDRHKRTPYMEQEYRRYWDEKLMFKDRTKKYSSKQPVAEYGPRTSVYHRNYETRSVLVDHARCYLPKGYRQTPHVENRKYRTAFSTNRGLAEYFKSHKGLTNGRAPLPKPQSMEEEILNGDGIKSKTAPYNAARGFSWLKKHKYKLR